MENKKDHLWEEQVLRTSSVDNIAEQEYFKSYMAF